MPQHIYYQAKELNLGGFLLFEEQPGKIGCSDCEKNYLLQKNRIRYLSIMLLYTYFQEYKYHSGKIRGR